MGSCSLAVANDEANTNKEHKEAWGITEQGINGQFNQFRENYCQTLLDGNREIIIPALDGARPETDHEGISRSVFSRDKQFDIYVKDRLYSVRGFRCEFTYKAADIRSAPEYGAYSVEVRGQKYRKYSEIILGLPEAVRSDGTKPYEFHVSMPE